MSGRRVILHIGQPKTGSTALQSFFCRNRAALEKQGIGYYLPLHRYDPWGGNANGSLLLAMALKRSALREGTIHDAWLKGRPSVMNPKWIEEDSEKAGKYAESLETLIFSEEFLWLCAMHHNLYWEAVDRAVRDLFGEDSTIEIIVYLRRQDLWALSWWKECVRSVDVYCALPFQEALEVFERNGYLDYERAVNEIARVFGADHVRVRAYHPSRFSGGDIFHDFLESTGYSWRDEYTVPEREENLSHTTDASDALRRIRVSGRAGAALAPYLWGCASLSSRLHPEDFYPLEQTEREMLLLRYAAGNEKLAAAFGGGEALFGTDMREKNGDVEPGSLRGRLMETEILACSLMRHAVQSAKRGLKKKSSQKESS